jgi:pre-mRNA-splicing factor SYF2
MLCIFRACTDEGYEGYDGELIYSLDKGKKRVRPKKDEETDVTYINDRNKVFNRKLVRYFDKYTKECVLFRCRGVRVGLRVGLTGRIRANFERGTAL